MYENSFSTGYVFYYWPYYKTKSQLNYDRNDGNCPKEMYLKPKYGSLRDEMVNNKIHSIPDHQFSDIVEKANNFMTTSTVRSMRSCCDYLHYGFVVLCITEPVLSSRRLLTFTNQDSRLQSIGSREYYRSHSVL